MLKSDCKWPTEQDQSGYKTLNSENESKTNGRYKVLIPLLGNVDQSPKTEEWLLSYFLCMKSLQWGQIQVKCNKSS